MYPWRIFDTTNRIVYYSKTLKMDGLFVGVNLFGSEIQAYGYYERSEKSNIVDSGPIDKKFGIDTVEKIDKITVFGVLKPLYWID